MIKSNRKDWNSNREDWDSNKEDGHSTIRIMAICHKKIRCKKISNLSLKIICDKKNYGCKLVKLGPSPFKLVTKKLFIDERNGHKKWFHFLSVAFFVVNCLVVD